MSPDILFEDNHVIAVNKRTGFLSTADNTDKMSEEQSVREYLAQQKNISLGKVFLKPVHQLDLPVSGCLIFAKSSKAAERLSRSFQERKVQKIYAALSHVQIKDFEKTRLSCFIGWNEKLRIAQVSDREYAGSKKAELLVSYREKIAASIFLYEVELLTGRKHQIRAQLADKGLPILNDVHYGGKAFPSSVSAIGLHCRSLEFPHPIEGVVKIEAKMPEKFNS